MCVKLSFLINIKVAQTYACCQSMKEICLTGTENTRCAVLYRHPDTVGIVIIIMLI